LEILGQFFVRDGLAVLRNYLDGHLLLEWVSRFEEQLEQIVVNPPVFFMPLVALPGHALSELQVLDFVDANFE